MTTMNKPVRMRLARTARGTLRSGLRASPPSAVALSKPTRLKMQATMARLVPWIPTPLSDSCAVSTVKPCENSTTPARLRMHATDRPSRTRVMTEDSRMSL